MRRFCLPPLVGTLVLSCLSPALSDGTPCPGISGCTPLEVTDTLVRVRNDDAEAVLHDLNAKRANRGLPQLAEDPKLDALARSHALDMVAHGYFAHDTLDGRSPLQRMSEAGIPYGYAGENIAHNTDEEAANEALWESPPHRANRLQPHFAKVGIVALSTDGAGELIVEDYTD